MAELAATPAVRRANCVDAVVTTSAMAAASANSDQYRSASATAIYTAQTYHAVRRSIASEMLTRLLADGPYSKLPEGPLLEIGAGGDVVMGTLPHVDRLKCVADSSLSTLGELKSSEYVSIALDANLCLPLKSNSVAAVISTDLIEHLYDPMNLILELARVVRPYGLVVLTTPNLATLQDRFRFLFGFSPRQIDPTHEYLKLHIRHFTFRLLREMLKTAGFGVTDVRSNYVGFQVRRDKWIESKRLAKVAPGLGGSLIVAARRRPERPTPAHRRIR